MLSRFSGRILAKHFQRPTITNIRTFAIAKLKDKNAPEKPPNAYNVFVMERMPIFKQKSKEQLTLADLSKACALEWKTLSQDRKQQYHDQVKGQADEWKENMKAYKQTEDYAEFQRQKAQHAKREKLKEFQLKSAPKRARSSYIFYTVHAREKIKQEDPTASLTDIAKRLGTAWNNLSKEEKAVYEEAAKQDKARYEEEKELHEKSSEYQENMSKKEEYLATLKKATPAAMEKERIAKAKEKAAQTKAKEKAAKDKAAEAKTKAREKAAEAKAKEKARALKAKENAAKEKAAKAKAKAKEKMALEKKKAKVKREKEKAQLERTKAKDKREKEKVKLAAAKEKAKLTILALKQTKRKKVAASS